MKYPSDFQQEIQQMLIKQIEELNSEIYDLGNIIAQLAIFVPSEVAFWVTKQMEQNTKDYIEKADKRDERYKEINKEMKEFVEKYRL